MGIYNHFNIVLLWTMYLGLWCLTSLSVLLVEETDFVIVRKQTRGHRNLHNIYISYTKITKVQTLRQLEIQYEKRVNIPIPCMRTNHRTYRTPK